MVDDRVLGIKREVDTLIIGQYGPHEIRISIECRDWTIPQDVTWIDELIGKYRDLDIEKIIAVSASGFTDSAVKKANINGIMTLTLDDADGLSWETLEPFVIKEITIKSFRPVLQHVHVFADIIEPNVDELPMSEIIDIKSAESFGRLNEWILKVLNDPELQHFMESKIMPNTNVNCNVKLGFSKSHIILLGKTQIVRLLALKLDVLLQSRIYQVGMKHLTYGKDHLLLGYHSEYGHDFDVVLTRDKDAGRLTLGIHRQNETDKDK